MSDRIKVTYIISDINKALSFEWIATALDASVFNLSFILLNPGPSELETFLLAQGIPCTRIVCRGKKDWPMAVWQLLRLLRKQSPDIVHCHLLTGSILGLIAAKIAGVRTRIYTRHHSDYHFRYFPKGVKWDKLCNRLATRIIAPSGVVKSVLTGREGVSPAKTDIIYHGFELDYFEQVPQGQRLELQQRYNPEGKYPVVGVISRFTELKGIQYIIPAFRQLLQRYPDALLLLFNANGDYKSTVETLLATLPAESYRTVTFEKELAAAYTLFDVFVQASVDTHIESFGQTYVEAMAAGIPSVFTLAGIAGDIVRDRENALVVPFKDTDAIYDAITTILTDEALRQRIVAGGKQTVAASFQLQTMIQRLSQLYISSYTNEGI